MALSHVFLVGKPAAACKYVIALLADGISYTLAMASFGFGRSVGCSLGSFVDFLVFGVGIRPGAK